MKKVLSLVLAVLMVLSLSAVAFANNVDKYKTTPDSIESDKDADKVQLGIGDLGSESDDPNPDKPGATYYYTLLKKVDDDEDDEYDDLMFHTDDAEDVDYIEHLTISIKESGDEMMKDYAIVKHCGLLPKTKMVFWKVWLKLATL